MPIFEFTSPEGKTYEVEGPAGATREQAWQLLQRQLGSSRPETQEREREIGGKAYQFGRGVVQGALYDPIEGIGQLVEHAKGSKIGIPQGVRDWFDKVRENTEATTTGKVGRMAGMIGSLAVAPEAFGAAKAASIGYRASRATGPELLKLSQRLGRQETIDRISAYATKLGKHPRALTQQEQAEALLSRVPRAPLSRPGRVALQTAVGAGAGAAQPVADPDSEDFLAQKGYQALAGGALGGLAGLPLGGPVMRHIRRHPYHYGPWALVGSVTHPHISLPAWATLGGLAAQMGLEKAGPVVAAPLGAAAGRVLSGPSEETRNGQETE